MTKSKQSRATVFLSVLLLLLSAFLLLPIVVEKTIKPKQRIKAKALSLGLTENQAKLILAQSQHETGNFTSGLFLLYKNCFGMRPAQTRQADQLNYRSNDAYAHYDSIEQSVHDLILWMNAKNFVWYDTPELYCEELKRHDYFTDTLDNYTRNVEYYYDA